MSSTDFVTIFGVIAWILCNPIMSSISLYYCYNFYKNRSSLIIEKRFPVLYVISSISDVIFWFVYYSVLVFGSFMKFSMISSIIVGLIGIPFIVIEMSISFIRGWLLFYSVRLQSAILQQKWTSIICPVCNDKNFWIQNKPIIGCWCAIKYKVYFYISLCIVIVTPVWFFEESNIYYYFGVNYAIFVLFVVPCVGYVYFVVKLPKFEDNIGIRDEIKYNAVLSISWTLLFVCWVTGWYVYDVQDRIQNVSVQNIYTIIGLTLIRCVGFIIHLRHTKYILTKYDPVIRRYSTKKTLQIAHTTTFAQINQSNDAIDINSKVNLSELKNYQFFDAFMQQLLHEHSSECLLSVIEMMQYQEMIYNNMTDSDKNAVSKCDISLILPNDCPKSFIVAKCNNVCLIYMHILTQYNIIIQNRNSKKQDIYCILNILRKEVNLK